jgi:prevent-host-death family protein
MRVGLRDANQHFSRIIKAVRAGAEVVLTERGQPLATIAPVRRGAGPGAAIARLEAAGILRAAASSAPLPAWTPPRLRGAPITRTIREEREES